MIICDCYQKMIIILYVAGYISAQGRRMDEQRTILPTTNDNIEK